ncbi:MAG: sigma-70 family RNA polymerase sigma factor [Planctomycetota bacterium]
MASPVTDSMNDLVALQLYAERGDPRAFELLARRYGAMVLATCRRVLVNESDAEDAAQETFFKLTQNAGHVRSNVAAWLHGCAHGTSVDAVRKGAARRRAERSAAAIDRGDPAELTWREMESVIDAALQELDEADRDLIVARFLAGQTQRALASAAGVNEGTMSRRVDRSLDRLRRVLSAKGCALTAPLGAALLAGAAGQAKAGVPAAVLAGIGKAGLGGIVRGGSSGPGVTGGSVIGGSVIGVASVVVVCAVGLAMFGGSQSKLSAGASGRLPAIGVSAAAEPGPKRLTKEIGPFVMVSATEQSFRERGIRIRPDRIAISYGLTQENERRQATLRILEREPIDGGVLLTTRVERISPIDDEWSRYSVGRKVLIEATFDDAGRLVLKPLEGPDGKTVQIGRNEPSWYGVRPPKGWPEYGQIPEDSGEHGLLGPWTEAERIQVRMDGRQIRFGADNWTFANYRIIEWDRREGYSRVLSVNAGGRDPRLIGTRFHLLLREEPESAGGGYSIAYFPQSESTERWPSSFEYSENNPVRVVRIGGGS